MNAENVYPMTDETLPPEDGGANAPKGGKGRARQKHINFGNVTRLVEHFALIYGTKTVWDGESHRIVPVDALRLALSHDAVKAWLAMPDFRQVLPENLLFEPGQEVADHQVQLFAGLATDPLQCTPEDCAPMLELLRHLCSSSASTPDGVKAIMHWVLCWQALPLQRIGTKMQTALVMHGPQGTGKNLYWDVWRDIYDRYGVTVGQTELEDKFNGWLSQKLAIIGDEVVSRQEMYHNKNRLKLIVTQETKFPIREIQQGTRWESNHCNVVFLSNESQPLALEERDRRYMVIYTPLASDSALYQRVRSFLNADGLRRWMWFLQHYPVGEFDRFSKPLMTHAKEALIQAGWKPEERFAHEWMNGFLPLPLRVCSAEQLYRAFRRWCDVNGERFPPSQGRFTDGVKRWMSEHSGAADEGAPLLYKVVALRHETEGRRAVRCWLPRGTGPLPGVTEGEWASESVQMFEQTLANYCRAANGGRGADDE